MFNGIIYNQGKVKNIQKNKGSIFLNIKTNIKIKKKEIGSSVSCNGVCLTVVSVKNKCLGFYVSKETMMRSNLNDLIVGSNINLEKSLRYGDSISGHYVQGHVDATAKTNSIRKISNTWVINFILKKKNIKDSLVEKASISINGVSLTISKITKMGFEVNVIPHTLQLTNLIKLTKGNYVNIEIDIFSKYFKKLKN